MKIFCFWQKSSKNHAVFGIFRGHREEEHLWLNFFLYPDLCFPQLKSLLRYFLTWSFSCDNFIFKLITKLLFSSYAFWYLSVLWRNEDNIFVCHWYVSWSLALSHWKHNEFYFTLNTHLILCYHNYWSENGSPLQ